MKKQLITLLLIGALALSLLSFAGCAQRKSVLTLNGEPAPAGFYAFYAHWQRDYMKEVLKNAGYDIGSHMDSYYSENQTVKEYIIATAKDRYLSFLAVSKQFDALGLTLSDEKQKEIQDMYDTEWIGAYGEAGMKNILEQLDLSKDEFMQLLSVQIKSDLLLDHYYGENGTQAITEQDKKDYFEKNYYRFKYVMLAKQTDEGNDLPAEEINAKRNTAYELVQKITDGTKIEDLIPEYSEDYHQIDDTMSAEDKESAESANQKILTEGLICDKNGIFNRTLYTYYNISVNINVTNALEKMNVGDVQAVDAENAIWVIQKFDLNESETYFNDREAAIYQAMYSSDFSAKYTRWLADLNYAFNEDALKEFDPAGFSDMFSEVYKIESTATAN